MWGDDLDAPRRLVEGGPLDYLMLDFLAEVTMSVLQRQKDKDPQHGWAGDVVGILESVLPAIRDRHLRVLANAGGVNPPACGAAVRAMLERAGAAGQVRVALLTGDDLLPRIDGLVAAGHEFRHMETGEPLASVRDRLVSANAYIGSAPLAQALAQGAHIVITGRCHDAALASAPFRHEFGWASTDYDRLAAATIAGHVIECGAQATGGNCLADWRSVPNLADVGYPIAEMEADGTCACLRDWRPARVHHRRCRLGLHVDPHRGPRGRSRPALRHEGPGADREAQGERRVPRWIQGGRDTRLRVARRP
jgi:hypothetical protein